MIHLAKHPAKKPQHSVPSKICSLETLKKRIHCEKAKGKTTVLCHGVFDLLHIGHIKHLEAAKELGQVLIVTVTPDHFVDKGPHRPAFTSTLRAEALASLSCVDYVAVNRWPSAVETLRMLKPNLYVKGASDDRGQRDHSNAIKLEEAEARSIGAKMVYTEEPIYSSSALISRYLDVLTPEAKRFLEHFRHRYSSEDIVKFLKSVRDLRVLLVGETIIDEYQFCSVMAKANKEPILAARYDRTEKYPGGILAVGNHVSNFCDRVDLLSMLGGRDTQETFVRSTVNPSVNQKYLLKSDSPTIVKRRFLEESLAIKLFEVYVMKNEELQSTDEKSFSLALEEKLPYFDLVIVSDYGHGLITEGVKKILCERAKFLAVNTQSNAGNRGFNMITKYPRADFVSIAEPEVRLAMHDSRRAIADLTKELAEQVDCRRFVVTRGKHGCLCYDAEENKTWDIPAFSVNVVDRIGAGDAVLSIAAPCVAKDVPLDAAGFICNVVGAEACATMGNSNSINPTSLFRHITSLMK